MFAVGVDVIVQFVRIVLELTPNPLRNGFGVRHRLANKLAFTLWTGRFVILRSVLPVVPSGNLTVENFGTGQCGTGKLRIGKVYQPFASSFSSTSCSVLHC